jgi:hypothetical protein
MLALLARFGHAGAQRPIVLWLEGGNELVALHAEAQRGRLAGSVGYHGRVQVAVLALQDTTCSVMVPCRRVYRELVGD